MENSFLQQTARAIVDNNDWTRLEQLTLVLPSHRAGLVLKNEIMRIQQSQGKKAIWAPTVMTLTNLQDTLSPLQAEDELLTIVRLYKHYRRVIGETNDLMPLDMFYGWGRQMIADFTNVDVSMEQEEVPNFFDNTIAAQQLSDWQLDNEVKERLQALIYSNDNQRTVISKSVQEQYAQLWEHLYELYQALRTEMLSEQKGYSGLRQRAVIDQWDSEEMKAKIANRHYAFVGFNYLLPAELELMKRLRDANQASFYWDLVTDFSTNEKAFSFAKHNKDILGSALLDRQWGAAKEVTTITCTSKEAQAQYVHQWLKENYTQQGQKVGVVICDEAMLEPIIYALPAITLDGMDTPQPINITKAYPLRNTEIYTRTIQWLYNQDKQINDQPAQAKTIDDLLVYLFKTTDTLQETDENDEAFTWQELLVLESEYQVRTILNKVKQLVDKGLEGIELTFKMLRLLIRRMLESVSMPFNGEPITDIQVMGVLETRMLDFDKLLLLNVEEGILPQYQADRSFIPYYLRKAYHMQTPDERATIYGYNFFRLLSRAQQTTILFSAAGTGGSGKGVSRFVMQMLVSPQFVVKKGQLDEPNKLQTISQPSAAAKQSLLSTLQVVDGQVQHLSGKRFKLSPSALNTYISCPLSFYYQYILGCKPKDEKKEVLFNANTLGSFVHHTMECLYKSFLKYDPANGPVDAKDIEDLKKEETLKEALINAYKAMNADWEKEHGEPDHYKMEEHLGENKVIINYVNHILDKDIHDAGSGALSLYQMEVPFKTELHIDDIGSVLIGGTIDRLDYYDHGNKKILRVIDYKSGAYDDDTHKNKMSATWDEIMTSADKGYVRQTMIYSYIVKQSNKFGNTPIEPHLYFCKKNLCDIKTDIVVEQQPITDFETLSDQFVQQLEAKTKELLTTTDFPMCEEGKCPSYCPFFMLCGRKPESYK